jgi:MoxR-like ATPase
MEERRVTVDGISHRLPEPFVVLATQNTAGSAGTQMLPSSQLDRFIIRTSMGYPDLKSQIEIMKDRHHENPLDKISPVTDKKTLNELIKEAQNVFVADAVYAYASELVEETRHNAYIQLGISPRGALALCRAAKAFAFLEGRDYVIPDDVLAVFPDVCAHRILLEAKARLHELSAEEILSEITKKVKKPEVTEFKIK